MQRVRSMPNAPTWLRNTTSEDLANPSVRSDSDQNTVIVLDAQNDHLISLTSNTDLHITPTDYTRWIGIVQRVRSMPNAPAWMKEKAEDLNIAAEYLNNSSVRSDSYNLIRFIRSIPNPHAWVNSTAESLKNAADVIDNPSAPPERARANIWAQIRSIVRSLPSPSDFWRTLRSRGRVNHSVRPDPNAVANLDALIRSAPSETHFLLRMIRSDPDIMNSPVLYNAWISLIMRVARANNPMIELAYIARSDGSDNERSKTNGNNSNNLEDPTTPASFITNITALVRSMPDGSLPDPPALLRALRSDPNIQIPPETNELSQGFYDSVMRIAGSRNPMRRFEIIANSNGYDPNTLERTAILDRSQIHDHSEDPAPSYPNPTARSDSDNQNNQTYGNNSNNLDDALPPYPGLISGTNGNLSN